MTSHDRRRYGGGTSPLVLNGVAFDRRMRELGYRGEAIKAAAVGTSRTTLHKLRRGETQVSLALALTIAEKTGLPIGELFLRRTA